MKILTLLHILTPFHFQKDYGEMSESDRFICERSYRDMLI